MGTHGPTDTALQLLTLLCFAFIRLKKIYMSYVKDNIEIFFSFTNNQEFKKKEKNLEQPNPSARTESNCPAVIEPSEHIPLSNSCRSTALNRARRQDMRWVGVWGARCEELRIRKTWAPPARTRGGDDGAD